MRPITHLGTARQRFLAEHGSSEEADSSSGAHPDVEEFEPAYLGWELARCAPGLSHDEQHALAAIGAACIASMLAGSTRLSIEGPSFAAALASAGGPAASVAVARRLLERARSPSGADSVGTVIGQPGERKPLLVDGQWLYLERMLLLEERFCARVRARRAGAVDAPDARAVRRAIGAVAAGPKPLTREQTRAVQAALVSPLTLIAGGPGTGKTMTVVALVRAAVWLGTPVGAVAIAAPTGKAAQRLSDALSAGLANTSGDIAEQALRATPPSPFTLHRLLGWSPKAGRFARHEGDPLSYRLVIVDEASMIDLAMIDRLVRALPERARLVLLGDSDQLPSIEAGAVFRDLCAGLGACTLTTNLRVAGAEAQSIVSVAEAMNSGELSARMTRRLSAADLAFEGVEHLDAPWSEVGGEVLERWWRTQVATHEGFAGRAARTYHRKEGVFDEADEAALRALLATYASARLLVATRATGFPACADAINRSLLGRLSEPDSDASEPAGAALEIAPGSPVLVQQNDYARGLFNGDQGVVARVDSGDGEGPRSMLVFPRGRLLDALPVDVNTAIAPAFAMTVHKAQGSEFDRVAMVLPDVDHPILVRELIYTAMTRARRSVLIVGPRDVLARAVSRANLRSSGVTQRLKPPKESP